MHLPFMPKSWQNISTLELWLTLEYRTSPFAQFPRTDAMLTGKAASADLCTDLNCMELVWNKPRCNILRERAFSAE